MHRPSHLLLVDDNPRNLQLLGEVFNDSDKYDLCFATSGIEALEILNHVTPDLILLDVDMPGMNGYEACARIQASKEYAEIPVIFLTAMGDTEFILKGFNAGGRDYVVKPFQPQELMARVDVHLDLQRTRNELRRQVEDRLRSEKELQVLVSDLMKSQEETRHANEEVRSFAHIVSHDLRAPLVNIKGFSAELEEILAEVGRIAEKIAGDSGANPHSSRLRNLILTEVPECLKYIFASVNRMDLQIAAILKISKAGRKELRPEIIHVNELVTTLLATLGHQIESKNVSVDVGTLPQVMADRETLEQIFGNILDNALKYMEPERPGRIAVTADQKHDEVVFNIRDNGRGIAREDMEKVFQIFRRAGKEDVAGEGIGMAYVKALVKNQGGRIWFESEPGTGTVFSFTVPVSMITDSDAACPLSNQPLHSVA